LKQALDSQRETGNRLATECARLGLASEHALLSVLSAQVGVPGVRLSRLVLPLTYLDVVPEQTAHKYTVLPVRVDGERIFLSMADPADDNQVSEIAFTSSRKVLPCVALYGMLRRAVEGAYAAKRTGELEYRGDLAEGDSASDEAMVLFVFSDELTQVPRELIDALGGKSAAQKPIGDIDEQEILIETEGDVDEELEVSIDQNNTLSLGRRRSGEYKPPHVSTQKILLVDDDPELRRLVGRTLRSRGYAVQEAGRGLEALNLLKSMTPDLILLDAMLPEIHGFDICRKLKSSDRYGKIPIIMISSIYRGWRFARDLKEAYGVSAFMEKPFDMATLETTVERVLASARRNPDKSNQSQVSTTAKKAIQEGVKRYKVGDIDGAIESYREGIRVDPLSARLHYQLAILFLKKKGMTYQAMQEFEEAVALEPEMFAALRNLAILYQSKGFKNKAIDLWERALRCSPDDNTREHIRKHLLGLI